MDINGEEGLQENYLEECPLLYTLNLIGGKWKIPILWELNRNKIMRFNELKRDVYGITNTMLSNSLQEMQKDNLVHRVQYNEMPLRVEYYLTDTGKEIFPILLELSKWGWKQMKTQNESKLNNEHGDMFDFS